MADSPAQYGRIPTKVVTAGALARLSRSELAVYLVIAAHVNGNSWSAWPSVQTIARLGGMGERTAQRATRQLVERGLISVQLGGGRGRSNHYTLRLPPGAEAQELQDGRPRRPGDTVSEDKPCHHGDTLSDEKPRQIGTETPSDRRRNPVKMRQKPRHPRATRTEEQNNSRNSKTAATGMGPYEEEEPMEEDAAVVAALIEAGIGGTKRNELTRRWSGIPGAAARIRDVAAGLRNRGKRSGAVVLELEAMAEKEAARLKRKQQEAAAGAEARRRTTERAEEDERRREAGVAWLAGLSDSRVQELWQQYLVDPRVRLALRTSMASGRFAVADIRVGFGEELAKLYGPETTEDPGV